MSSARDTAYGAMLHRRILARTAFTHNFPSQFCRRHPPTFRFSSFRSRDRRSQSLFTQLVTRSLRLAPNIHGRRKSSRQMPVGRPFFDFAPHMNRVCLKSTVDSAQGAAIDDISPCACGARVCTCLSLSLLFRLGRSPPRLFRVHALSRQHAVLLRVYYWLLSPI